MAHQPKRHPGNSNLHLYYENTFRGLPVMAFHVPFITEYLDSLLETTQLALSAHRQVFALRFDLRFPNDYLPPASSNAVISRFVASLSVRIEIARERAKRLNGSAHQTSVRWCWVREVGQEGRPHFHFVLLLNRDAFHTVGRFQSERENLYTRIQAAWASALRIHFDYVEGLVHIPANATFHLSRDDPAEMNRYFHRASYLCKAATKDYGSRCRAFGCSRG
ncbi:inovirus Gp2 family protein [Pseudomonas gingeri]|uniref:inovirus Gp2 family protein n=1 Tax=Pseudomonas gingeri TaxID=117681 RepID=UPI0021099BDA|nr:inovirus Gp2 family protein [Pseudomonas gingeri]